MLDGFPYVWPVEVRFRDLDALGHVNNAVFLTYLESCRIGYWLEYWRPYVTFHTPYIESVWWILKTIADKGLLYRGHKSVPNCPRCGTPLSSHEVAQGYRDVFDP